MSFFRQYRYFIIATLLVLSDQTTKMAVKGFALFGVEHKGMYLGESFPVIGDAIRFTFVENPGMAFGISWGDGKLYLTLVTIIVAGFLSWYLYSLRKEHPAVQTSVMLVLAGAVGNLIDRVFYGVFYGESALFHGRVVDFIQVDIPDVDWMGVTYTHFPVFNIADSCVSVGIVMLLLVSSKMPKPKNQVPLINNEPDAKATQAD
ncbi:MAG: signal peptidase II [Ignavibacteria bacterium]|nr:signal peptidase II [Ignavibacteria bacterium]